MIGSIAALTIMTAALMEGDPVDLSLLLPDKAVVELRLEKKERMNEGPWVTTRSAYRIEITPIDEFSYRTVWTDLDDLGEPKTVFITDEALVPVRFENYEDLMVQMAQEAEPGSPEAKENAQVLAIFQSMSVETLTSLVAKDFILASYGQGTALVPGVPRTYQQPGGSFGDGDPLMMNASFLLESVKPTGTAVVVWTSELDPVEAQKAFPRMLADMMASLGRDDVPSDAKLASVMRSGRYVIRTECRYQIDVETGLATSSECNSLQDIAMADETSRTETRLMATQVLLD